MNAKYPIKAFDGTSFSDVQVLNVPAGAIDSNGEIDLGQGVKVYRALLTQTGTDAPVATVLENTLGGTVVWAYYEVGRYIGILTAAFTANKTCLPYVNATATMESTPPVLTSFFRLDANTVRIETAVADIEGATNTLTNDLLTAAYVEILVYPS